MATVGRPPRKTKQEIDKEIKFYWIRNINPMEVIERTDHTFRTVDSRYKKWDGMLQKRKDKSFLESQDKKKERAVVALDKQLTEMVSVQQDILHMVEEIKKSKLPITMEQLKPELRTKLAWMIFDLTDRKAALELTPSVAEKVKEEVKELIDKYQKQPITEEDIRRGQ